MSEQRKHFFQVQVLGTSVIKQQLAPALLPMSLLPAWSGIVRSGDDAYPEKILRWLFSAAEITDLSDTLLLRVNDTNDRASIAAVMQQSETTPNDLSVNWI